VPLLRFASSVAHGLWICFVDSTLTTLDGDRGGGYG